MVWSDIPLAGHRAVLIRAEPGQPSTEVGFQRVDAAGLYAQA